MLYDLKPIYQDKPCHYSERKFLRYVALVMFEHFITDDQINLTEISKLYCIFSSLFQIVNVFYPFIESINPHCLYSISYPRCTVINIIQIDIVMS